MCQCHSCVPLAVSSVDPIFLFFSQHQVTSVSHSIVEVVEVTFNGNLNVHVITPLAKCLMSNTGSTYYYNCSTKDGQGNPMYLSFPLPAQGKIQVQSGFFRDFLFIPFDSYQFEVTTKNVEFFPQTLRCCQLSMFSPNYLLNLATHLKNVCQTDPIQRYRYMMPLLCKVTN